MSEGIARERESLVSQLDLLRTINSQLRDEQDQYVSYRYSIFLWCIKREVMIHTWQLCEGEETPDWEPNLFLVNCLTLSILNTNSSTASMSGPLIKDTSTPPGSLSKDNTSPHGPLSWDNASPSSPTPPTVLPQLHFTLQTTALQPT